MEWNRIQDKSPKKCDNYLCVVLTIDKSGGFERDIQILYYGNENHWYACDECIVTHWMELPEMPKEVF